MGVFVLIAAAALAVPTFVDRPCAAEHAAMHARCGTVAVPEDRAAPGRTIALNVVVLPAVGARTLPPLFEIEGGPGLAVTNNAGFYIGDGAAYRRGRDVVLVDQRGMGGSGPLRCPELEAAAAALQPAYPVAAVARCREALSAKVDLRRYGTDAAAADLDAVRRALGYPRIDLSAVSYGTTVALRYLAAYPGVVRAAVLMSVVPASATPPRDHAITADAAMTRLFALCEADAACGAAFDPAADFARAMARLPDATSGLTPAVFAEKLRSLMYQPVTARRVPMIVHQAAAGNLEPFFALTRSDGPSAFAEGAYLSITCSESLAAMDYNAAAAAARQTRFGDYRLARQRAACAEWPVAEVPAAFFAPVQSDTAVLMISGGLDPVTPAAWGTEALAGLPNGQQLVIAAAGHGIEGLAAIDSCFDPMLVAFLTSGDAKAADAACLAEMTAPAFALTP